MTPDELKTWVEIVQGIVTCVGILAAGIWSFFTFVLGRSFAPNIQIQFDLKQIISLMDGRAAVVTVRIKNIGRAKVRKLSCHIASTDVVVSTRSAALPLLSRLDTPLDYSQAEVNVYRILETHSFLEPGEETNEDVLFKLGESPILKVGVLFTDLANTNWSSTAIFDIQDIGQAATKKPD